MHLRLLTCLGFLIILGCDNRHSATSNNSNSPGTTINLDGNIDKWLNKTPAWDGDTIPATQAGDRSQTVTAQQEELFHNIHIRKVYFDNDSRYLYIFIQCSPTVQERYKLTHLSGGVGQLFIDPENNADSGSQRLISDADPKYRGYKIRVSIDIGAYTGASSGGADVSYDLFQYTEQRLNLNNGFNTFIPNSEQDSMQKGALIAHGKDGVEMAIPMKTLGLKPGSKARFLIAEWKWLIDPHTPVGFATYQCK